MRKIMRKAVSIMLAVMLAISVVPIDSSVVFAAEEDEELVCDGFKYRVLDDDTAKITGYIDEDAEVKIPETLGDYRVTSIGDWAFSGCNILTSVEIPSSVTSIGEFAFYRCISLAIIKIPVSVTSIDNYVFEECDKFGIMGVSGSYAETYANENNITFIDIDSYVPVTSITLSETEKTVTYGDSFTLSVSFEPENASFKDVVWTTSDDWVVWVGSDGKFHTGEDYGTATLTATVKGTEISTTCEVTVIPEELLTSGDYQYRLLEDNTAEIASYIGVSKDIVIPATLGEYEVSSIGKYAFDPYEADYDYSIVSVTIPEGVKEIKNRAFMHCGSLKNINMPDSLTYIGSSAFSQCTKLENVNIPSGVETIEANAFYNCYSLESITVAENNGNLTSIDGVVYDKGVKTLILSPYAKENVSIPNGVEVIAPEAFRNSLLENIEIPDSVTRICDDAFRGCPNLRVINIPESVTNIEFEAFDYGITICGVRGSAAEAYASDNEIDFVDINNIVKVTEISLNETEKTVGLGCSFYLLATALPENSSFKKFLWTSDNTDVVRVDEYGNVYAQGYGTANITATALDGSGVTASCKIIVDENAGAKGFNYYLNSDGTVEITSYHGSEQIVEIPEYIDGGVVKSIGYYAFGWRTDVVSVQIPSTVESIDYYAFYGCANLRSVNIPNSVRSISDYAFEACDKVAITGISGSYAQTYADTHSIRFIDKNNIILVSSITLSETEKTVNYGDSFTLSVTYGPEDASFQDVVWSTSDDWIVWIGDDGTFHTGYECGTVTLTAIAADGSGAKATCEVTVTPPAPRFYYNLLEDGNVQIVGMDGAAKELVIPDEIDRHKVTGITDYAFEDSDYGYYVTSIVLPEGINTIGSKAFYGLNNLMSIKVDANNEDFISIDGVLYDKDVKTLVSFPCAKESIEFPSGLTKIGNRAFRNAKITDIDIPEGVTHIGDYAFYGSNLSDIYIPSGVTNIGAEIFDCEANFIIYGDKGSYAEEYAGDWGYWFIYTDSSDVIYADKITLSETEMTVGLNCTFDITATVAPENSTYKNVIWSSSDGDVAYVDKYGNVTVYSYGTTVITAKAIDGSGVTASCTVTVDKNMGAKGFGYRLNSDGTAEILSYFGNSSEVVIPKTIDGHEVTSIAGWAFNYEDYYYDEDDDMVALQRVELPSSITVVNNNAFNCCENMEVVINSGDTYLFDNSFNDCKNLVIYGIPGSFVETYAKAHGISFYATDKVYVSSVSLNINEKTLEKGESITLLASVLPDNATDSGVTWTSSNTNVAIVDANGKVAAIGKGTATITVTANDGSKVAATCTVTVTEPITPTEPTTPTTPTEPTTPTTPTTPTEPTTPTTPTQPTTPTTPTTPTEPTTPSTPATKTKGLTAKNITLKSATATYTGKAIKMAVTVKDGSKTLKSGTDYTVTYKNNKNVGTATVTIKGKGGYTGTVTKTFKINPKKQTIKLKALKKGFKVSYTKATKAEATGYEIKYATSKSALKKAKAVTVKSYKTAAKSISKLKAGKKYFVQVRTYKKVGKTNYYGTWSAVKSIKTKK